MLPGAGEQAGNIGILDFFDIFADDDDDNDDGTTMKSVWGSSDIAAISGSGLAAGAGAGAAAGLWLG